MNKSLRPTSQCFFRSPARPHFSARVRPVPLTTARDSTSWPTGDAPPPPSLSDGGSNGLPPKSGDSGDKGDGNGGNDPKSDIALILSAAGRRLESLPADMQTAFHSGTLLPSALERFLSLEANWFFKIFMPLQGFRERLMADPGFFVKLGIECGIGIGTKCAAEAEKRKGRFSKELDFVTANVIMAIIADFMLVWLPAPTMSFATATACKAPQNAIARFFSCCPDNAFQKVPKGFPSWSLAQRAAAPIRNGAKLLCVGFAASMLGVGITNCLIWVRSKVNPESALQTSQAQNPLVVSSAYATYMATSSNLRYQFLAGVLEERGVETLFAGNRNLCAALSFVLRTSNTFLGSLMWVDFIRLLGLQPKNDAPAPETSNKKKK